jgi:transposase
MTAVQSPEDVRDAIVKGAEGTAARISGKAGTKTGRAGAKIGVKGTKLGIAGLLFGAKAAGREKLRPARDAKLKVQLARTSRELSNEASDIGAAIEALNQAIESNRKAGAVGRTRLFAGIGIGAVAAYHLDAEHGRQRRAATTRRLKGLAASG